MKKTKTKYEFHRLAKLLPAVAGTELSDLVKDVREKGLLNPIVRHDGAIIDGAARLEACKQAHVDPRFVEFSSLGLKCTPEDFIWSANVERRHLSSDQRAALAFEWAETVGQESKARQRQALETKAHVEGGSTQPNATRRKLADRAKVSTYKIQQMQKVNKGAPELVPVVASGHMKLKDAVKRVNRKRRKSKVLRMPTRNALTPKEAVSRAMKSLSTDVKKLLRRVSDKTNFFEILADQVSQWCRKMSKAA